MADEVAELPKASDRVGFVERLLLAMRKDRVADASPQDQKEHEAHMQSCLKTMKVSADSLSLFAK